MNPIPPQPSDFDLFWAAYPKRRSKKDAEKAWMQTKRERPPLPVILAKIEELKGCRQWKKDDGDRIPYPATWLRAGGWDDEVEVTNGRQAGRPAYAEPTVSGTREARIHYLEEIKPLPPSELDELLALLRAAETFEQLDAAWFDKRWYAKLRS